MVRIILITIAILTLNAGFAAAGANRSTETWQANWSNKSCTIDLTFERDGFDGEADPRRRCGKLLRKARSFQYPTPDRLVLVLFSRKKGRGKPLAIFNQTAPGVFQATIKSTEVSMTLIDQTNLRDLGARGSDQSDQSTCLIYANSGACVAMDHVENPDIPAFESISLQALKSLDIYPFSGGKGIAGRARLEKGQCYRFKKCETAFNSTEDWCEVSDSENGVSGWALRRDSAKVYLKPGC